MHDEYDGMDIESRKLMLFHFSTLVKTFFTFSLYHLTLSLLSDSINLSPMSRLEINWFKSLDGTLERLLS